MITREKLSRGEGKLVEGDPEIGSRKSTSQSENMAYEEGMFQNEIDFQKTFFAMSGVVRSYMIITWNERGLSKGNL
jgi:hypothetical protein